ncbi:MAG: response regulator [Campylobacterota bacterium]|nr:response regulator [Campylobacterota bacterium]
MLKLLIVDDSKLIHFSIKKIIEENYTDDIEIKDAYNGNEAIEITNEFNPDIVLLDIVMPEKDGIETLKELRKAHRRLNVLMISSMGTKEKIADALRYGARGFIQKPFDEDEFIEHITKIQSLSRR